MIFDPVLLVIAIIFAAIGWLVSRRLKSRFKEYAQVPIASGLSGKEVAEKMLRENNIHDVQVVSVAGQLTDHYNPQKKTVNLSPDVYSGSNVASAAVAAHETGHAIQHATAYGFLHLRSSMVPVVSLSSRMLSWVFIASFFMAFSFQMFSYDFVLWLVIILQGVVTLFSFITLPVEIDASNRALAWLQGSRVTGAEHDKAQNALKWAAMTYVVAALGSLAVLLYYIMILLGRRD